MLKKYIFLACILIMSKINLVGSSEIQKGNENEFLKIIIASEKNYFLLGEPVYIKTKIINISSKAVKIWRGYGLYGLKLYISEGKEYQEYRIRYDEVLEKKFFAGGEWQELLPGNKVDGDPLTILYRVIPQNDSFTDGYAFPRIGHYKIKVISTSLISDQKFESNVIEIDVKEPQGKDLLIWRKINTPEYAKFIHFGAFWDEKARDSSQTKEAKTKESKIVEDLRNIISQYSDSNYTPYIKEALIKYYRTKPVETKEEARKRDEYLKTLEKDKL